MARGGRDCRLAFEMGDDPSVHASSFRESKNVSLDPTVAGQFLRPRLCAKRLLASAAVPLLVLVLIGVTVPARLRHRQWAIEAKGSPSIRQERSTFAEYRKLNRSLPGDQKDLLKRLPDPDGSIAKPCRISKSPTTNPVPMWPQYPTTATIPWRSHPKCITRHGRRRTR